MLRTIVLLCTVPVLLSSAERSASAEAMSDDLPALQDQHTPLEAEILFLLNRMRADPQWELPLLALEARIGIAGALPHSDHALALAEMAEVAALPPVLPEPRLRRAARNHAEHLVLNGLEGHGQLPHGPAFTGRTPLERARHVGYPGLVAENVYRDSYGSWNAHQGFLIDWGQGPDGLLPGRGHRLNRLDPRLPEIGIAARPHGMHAAVVEVYGGRSGLDRLVGGIVYDDANDNGRFDAGEERAGVPVRCGEHATHSDRAGVFRLDLPLAEQGDIHIDLPEQSLAIPLPSEGRRLWFPVVVPVVRDEAALERALERLEAERGDRRIAEVETWLAHRHARVSPTLRERLESACHDGRAQWREDRARVLHSLAFDHLHACSAVITATAVPYRDSTVAAWFAEAEVANRALHLTALFLGEVRSGTPIPVTAHRGLSRKLDEAGDEIEQAPFADLIANLQWRISSLRRSRRVREH